MNEALQCVAHQKRFVIKELPAGLVPDVPYSVTLNDMNSVPLPSEPWVYLVAGQTIKFYEDKPDGGDERYRVQTLSYTYAFTVKKDNKEVELLNFAWQREPDPSNLYPRAHLHVGTGLLAKPTPIRTGNFHKAHIPTGRLSFEAIVRFAIREFDVKEQRDDWEPLLDASEAKFEAHKTSD